MLLTRSSWAGFAPGLQTRALAGGWEADHGPEAKLGCPAGPPSPREEYGMALPALQHLRGWPRDATTEGSWGGSPTPGGQRDSPLCLGQRREMGFLKGPLAYPSELYPRTGTPPLPSEPSSLPRADAPRRPCSPLKEAGEWPRNWASGGSAARIRVSLREPPGPKTQGISPCLSSPVVTRGCVR